MEILTVLLSVKFAESHTTDLNSTILLFIMSIRLTWWAVKHS